MDRNATADAKSMIERRPLAAAWGMMLLVSMLPNIVFHEVAHLSPSWLFWAWFIHLLQDVLIFFFMAVGAVTPGG